MFRFLADAFHTLLIKLHIIPSPNSRAFDFDAETVDQLRLIAGWERRPEKEVATELMSNAIQQRYESEKLLKLWDTLTPREKQIVALAALGYTNAQIAEHYSISQQTVKSHLHSATNKFGLKTKHQLVHLLSGWDFESWLKSIHQRG